MKNNNYWNTCLHKEQLKNKYIIQKRWMFIEQIINKLPSNSLSILDAGCGDGNNLYILNKYKKANIYGTDYNPLRISRAKRNHPLINFFNIDLNDLKTYNKFDVVILSQVLEHINNDDLVLKNLYNSLKSNGILIIGVPNEGCFLAQCRNKLFQFYIQRTTDHVNFYTEDVIRNKIENVGFEIKDVMYEGFFFPHTLLTQLFYSFNIGIKIIEMLSHYFKSQTGGYYLECIKN